MLIRFIARICINKQKRPKKATHCKVKIYKLVSQSQRKEKAKTFLNSVNRTNLKLVLRIKTLQSLFVFESN